jgi:hypothetical protein
MNVQYVFDNKTEFVGERSTGFGQTGFDTTSVEATAPAPWRMSAHSTFEEPSHSHARVENLREQRRIRVRILALTTLLVGLAVGALSFALFR